MKLAQLTAPVNERSGHLARRYSVLKSGEKLPSTRITHHSLHWTANLTRLTCVSVILALGASSVLLAGAKREPAQGKSELSDTVRLRLEVTGGETSTPIDSASIYVRYVVKHRMGKDEPVEMNLKTNHEGTVIVPGVPRGEVTVQVIAEHWKPFGQKYQATEDQQVIKVHLEKPPRWY
jgi:hypothetical protein